MTRILVLAFLFFLAEVYLLETSLNKLYQKDLWTVNFKNDSQRRVFKIMQNIHRASVPSVFVFGGSASREFFTPDSNMTKTLGIPFYNCAVSSESAYDSLKLQTLVKPNSIIIYGLHPKSFYDHSFDYKQVTEGHYFGGAYYKYPLVSDYLNAHVNADANNSVSTLHRLSPILNTYIYLLKEYIKNHSFTYITSSNLPNKKEPRQYRYIIKPMNTQKLHQKLKKYFQKSIPHMQENLKLNFFLLENMAQLAIDKNNKFILFELPFSPIVQKKFNPYLPAYRQALDNLLKKYPNIIFIPNSTLPPAKQQLFFDTIHLLPAGRDYYYKATAKSLKQVIQP